MSGAAAAEGGGERGGDARCGTELLVITHEDARFALTTDLDAKRPKVGGLGACGHCRCCREHGSARNGNQKD